MKQFKLKQLAVAMLFVFVSLFLNFGKWISGPIAIVALFVVCSWGSGPQIRILMESLQEKMDKTTGTFLCLGFVLGVFLFTAICAFFMTMPLIVNVGDFHSSVLRFGLVVLAPTALLTWLRNAFLLKEK